MKERHSEERISIRTSTETKRYLIAAAALSGFNNLTSFVLASAHREAQKVMNESQNRVLSKSDMELVISILENPPEPNAKLKALMLTTVKRYETNKE